MSHSGNTTILEQHYEDALELTRVELLAELGINTDPRLEQVDSFLSNEELAEHVSNKRFSESPQIPC
jgi:hypothetical protein